MEYRDGDILDGWKIDNHGRASGDYLVNQAGEIIRLDIPGFMPSGGWLVRSVFETAPFGRLKFVGPDWKGALDSIAALSYQGRAIGRGGHVMLGNGKPRFFLGDYDHGTARTQMGGFSRVVRGCWKYREARAHRTEKPYWEYVGPAQEAAA